MGKESLKHNILLHFIVVLLGFTAILGKLISLPAYELVWSRMLIAVLSLLLIIAFTKQKLRLPIKAVGILMFIGIIIAVHWICFFHAIKVSNVSVTLGCLSVTTLFTSFIEPLVQKRKISLFEVLIGLIIILGIYIIFRFETRYVTGIIFSLLAALLASIFSVINKQISLKYRPDVTSFYEMLGGLLAVSVYLFAFNDVKSLHFDVSAYDVLFIIILGTVCTAFAFSATIRVMQKLSAYQVVLAINLEPVYGILAAYFIFGESEKMTPEFYIGAAIILCSVIAYTYVKNRPQKIDKVEF